jgi:hypothetical protein
MTLEQGLLAFSAYSAIGQALGGDAIRRSAVGADDDQGFEHGVYVLAGQYSEDGRCRAKFKRPSDRLPDQFLLGFPGNNRKGKQWH